MVTEPFETPPDVSKHGIYIGTSGYSFKDWNGVFYPPKIPRRNLATASAADRANQDNFTFYQNYFPFVEINYTYYQEPTLRAFVDFCRRAKETTQFTVKVNHQISHTKSWDIAEGKTRLQQHIQAVSPLVESGRFYSFLIQLEDRLAKHHKVLDYLIEVAGVAVAKGLDVHIEFRNITWHQARVLQRLQDFGIGLCNSEIPRVPHAFPLKSYATSQKGYIRYSGLNLQNWTPPPGSSPPGALSAKEREARRNARYDYLYTEDEVRERVQGQITLSSKVNSLAVAYNNHFNAAAVANAIQNIRFLKKHFDVIWVENKPPSTNNKGTIHEIQTPR